MKTFLSLLFIAGLTTLAHAAPYIVYTGVAYGSDFGAPGAVKKTTYLYLVTDIAHSSSFALMQVDTTTTKPQTIYTINSRPSASPTTEETNNNFIGGITATNGRSGIGTFSYGSDTVLSNNTFISHAYSTGPLTLRSTTLVPARKALTVNLKLNGAPNGTASFLATPAVTSGANAFAATMSGTYFNYEIGSGGPLANVSTKSTFTLTQNALLTMYANIGGGYTTGTGATLTTTAIQPIPASTAAAYSTWLNVFALQNKFTAPVPGNTEAFGTLQ
jgi:hypothetical protein